MFKRLLYRRVAEGRGQPLLEPADLRAVRLDAERALARHVDLPRVLDPAQLLERAARPEGKQLR
eukprot:6830958-Prymnesium_polylepis.1